MSFWSYIFLAIGTSLSSPYLMAQSPIVVHDDWAISQESFRFSASVLTEQENTRNSLAAVCRPIASSVMRLRSCTQSASSITSSTEDTLSDAQEAACAAAPSNGSRFSSSSVNDTLTQLNQRSIRRFVNIGYRLQSLMDVSSAVRDSANLENGAIRNALNNCSLSAVAGVATHLSDASGISSGQEGEMACDMGRCSALRQNFFNQVSSIVGLDQSREWNLAQINDHIESRSTINCFKSRKELLLAQMVSEGYSNDLSDEQRTRARRLILERQLAVFPSTAGVCQSEDSREGFKDLVSGFVKQAGDPSRSASFFKSSISSILNPADPLPAATSPFFSAFKFSPILYHQLTSSVVSNPSMSVSDCENTLRTLTHIKTFYDSSLSALDEQGDGSQFLAFVRAHDTLDRSTNANSGTVDSIANSLIRECNDFKLSFVATNCSSDRALLSAPSFVQQLLQAQANPLRKSDQRGAESICISRQQAGESPIFQGAGALLTDLVSNNSHSSVDFYGNNIAANERYCPGFESFVQSNSNQFCSGQSIEVCFQSMSDSARDQLRQAYFTAHPDGARLRQLHVGLEAAAKVSNAINTILSSQLLNETTSRVISRYQDNPRFNALVSALGGAGSSVVKSATNVAVSTGSFISAGVAGAFAAQAKVSNPTAAALTNRFIAAAPEISSIATSAEVRSQVGAAVDQAISQTIADLDERQSRLPQNSNDRQQLLDEMAELQRLLANETAKNDLISQQITALSSPSEEAQPAAQPQVNRAPASVVSDEAGSTPSSGFRTGGGASAVSTAGSVGGAQELLGPEVFGGDAVAARSVSSISEAIGAAPNDSSLSLVVGGQGGQEIAASQVVSITVPSSSDEQALKEAILGQRSRLNVGDDGFAIVEVIDATTGVATLVRVKIDNDDVIVENFTAEQLRNTTIVSESDPEPRQIRYSLQTMTSILNQASEGSN